MLYPLAAGLTVVATGGAAAPILAAVPFIFAGAAAIDTVTTGAKAVQRNQALYGPSNHTALEFNDDVEPSDDPCAQVPRQKLVRREVPSDECCSLSIPERWQLTPDEVRPQLVIQYAERFVSDGKVTFGPPAYQLTIPHFNNTGPITTNITGNIKKGNLLMTYKLKDNSKVIVIVEGEPEGLRVLEAIKVRIRPSMLTTDPPTFTKLNPNKYRKYIATPRLMTYYSGNSVNGTPEWKTKVTQ
jgi:hypothetical protein